MRRQHKIAEWDESVEIVEPEFEGAPGESGSCFTVWRISEGMKPKSSTPVPRSCRGGIIGVMPSDSRVRQSPALKAWRKPSFAPA